MKSSLKYKKEVITTNIKKIDITKIFHQKAKGEIIYILYKNDNKKIVIAMEKSLSKYKSKGYKVIGSKVGSEREFKLVQMLMLEMNKNNNIKTTAQTIK